MKRSKTHALKNLTASNQSGPPHQRNAVRFCSVAEDWYRKKPVRVRPRVRGLTSMTARKDGTSLWGGRRRIRGTGRFTVQFGGHHT